MKRGTPQSAAADPPCAELRVLCDLQVQDGGTQQGLNAGTLFTRSLRLPPIWNFYTATVCRHATYAAPSETLVG